MPTVADRIKEVLEETGISSNELYRRTGISGGYISNLEARARRRAATGVKPSTKAGPTVVVLQKIADHLKVRLEWLVEGKEPKWIDPAPRPYKESPSYREAEPFAMRHPDRRDLPDMAFRLAGGMPAHRNKPVYDVADVLAVVTFHWRFATEAEVQRVEGELRLEQERAEGVVRPLHPQSDAPRPSSPKNHSAHAIRASRRK
jgi:transcriptional regulator with XRE-family HTH domain